VSSLFDKEGQRALNLTLNSPRPSLNKEGDLLIASASSLFDKEGQKALNLTLNSPRPSLNKEGDLLIASASSLFYKEQLCLFLLFYGSQVCHF